ncbi:hypothetical protein CKO25_12680 [Thiocapsa imhoffii]|uniref:histidine kinase n=1 Tax=Thiocapsa imhoffii TaxID=382777 RepID=A0A9X1B9N2_9GAMM|nr:sensor histidine kinase [Thiocapsa imhoffii]MBK1645483.1 hypothetical protein [Thiocapsa imhoffii]
MSALPLHRIVPGWNEVLIPFRERDYGRALTLALAFLDEIAREPALAARLGPQHLANIHYTIAESAFGVLDTQTLADMDAHPAWTRFFQAIDDYLRILDRARLEQPDEGWWQIESFPITLFGHTLHLLLRAGASSAENIEARTLGFMAIWPDLALRRLLEAIQAERLDVLRPGHLERTQTLAGIYLRLSAERPADAYRQARAQVMDMLADLTYFTGTNTAEDQALAWLEQALATHPEDPFARQRIKDIRDRRTVMEQIRRFNHDANTAIADLLSNLDRLESSALPEQAGELVERMRRGVQRIHGVHRFVQRQQAQFTFIPLRRTIERLVHGYNDLAIQISGADDEARLETDPDYFQIVLDILIRNAIEAFERQGIDPIERRLEIDFDPMRQIIQVRDNAGGIDPRLRERLFEPYVSSKAVKQTTGLGLANARAIMALFDGQLTLADPQPLGGAEFLLYF